MAIGARTSWSRSTRDRRRDAWLREHGWLMFRVDIENRALLPSQIKRVLDVVRVMARA